MCQTQILRNKFLNYSARLQRKRADVPTHSTCWIFMRNVYQILQSIKDYKGFETNAGLAEFLGVSRATISNWIARNTINEQLIQERIPEIRLEFLRTGKNPMTEQKDIISILQKKIEYLERRIEELEKYGKD